MAFDSKFNNTCWIRCTSPISFSCLTWNKWTRKSWNFWLTEVWTIVITLCNNSPISNSSSVSKICPLSTLDISKTSLIKFNNNLEETIIFFKQSTIRSRSSICILAIVVIPIMAFIGVRISWLIRDKKSDLAWFADLATCRASWSNCLCRSSSRTSIISVRVKRSIFLSLSKKLKRIFLSLKTPFSITWQNKTYSREFRKTDKTWSRERFRVNSSRWSSGTYLWWNSATSFS